MFDLVSKSSLVASTFNYADHRYRSNNILSSSWVKFTTIRVVVFVANLRNADFRQKRTVFAYVPV